jgi:hypothetical protein
MDTFRALRGSSAAEPIPCPRGAEVALITNTIIHRAKDEPRGALSALSVEEGNVQAKAGERGLQLIDILLFCENAKHGLAFWCVGLMDYGLPWFDKAARPKKSEISAPRHQRVPIHDLPSIGMLFGLLAIIALVLTAFGCILGIVKPAAVPKRVAAIVGIVIEQMLAPCILAGVWSAIPLWQRLALAAIALGLWQWRRLW